MAAALLMLAAKAAAISAAVPVEPPATAPGSTWPLRFMQHGAVSDQYQPPPPGGLGKPKI
jgi:hypothetical protein